MSQKMALCENNSKLEWTERFKGLLALLTAYIALRFFSLLTISQLLRAAKRYCSRPMSLEEANTAWEAVQQAHPSILGRIACLEFSLALVFFAFSKGLDVTWCIGVKLRPFESHAWIEINDKPFREPEYVEQEMKKMLVV